MRYLLIFAAALFFSTCKLPSETTPSLVQNGKFIVQGYHAFYLYNPYREVKTSSSVKVYAIKQKKFIDIIPKEKPYRDFRIELDASVYNKYDSIYLSFHSYGKGGNIMIDKNRNYEQNPLIIVIVPDCPCCFKDSLVNGMGINECTSYNRDKLEYSCVIGHHGECYMWKDVRDSIIRSLTPKK
jgi:hypothetical protein